MDKKSKPPVKNSDDSSSVKKSTASGHKLAKVSLSDIPKTDNPADLPWPVVLSPISAISEEHYWYRTAVFYEVLLKSFSDSNGDGIGDLPGLKSRLGYLSWLGVNCLWIPPFYPSPMADGGYDVMDYTAVDPSYGTMDDFHELIAAAHAHGIRIVIDMVFNHTSDQHPWFKASRKDPTGPYGDYYVWRDTPTEYLDARIIFVDTEISNWAWDAERKQFYWHRFFHHQPDLNFENPDVKEEMKKILRFWCDTGIDGIRLDAIPYLFEEDGTNCENLPQTHKYLVELRELIDEEYPGTILIAEANQPPAQVVDYFGSDTSPECHISFHFPVMPKVFSALHQESSKPIRQIIAETPPLPSGGQWGTFLRNHDELTLEMVDEEERENMYAWYAPEPRMRSNIGIRRRLSPLLGGGRRLIELAHCLLLSLPGSPFLYYGDEIGMGDNIWLSDRDGNRTPMQWNSSASAGFSSANPEDLHLPIVDSPAYGQESINVEESMARRSSFLNWLQTMLQVRHDNPVLGTGAMNLLSTDDDAILAFTRRDEQEAMLCVYNMSTTPKFSRISLPGMGGWTLSEARSGNEFPAVDENESLGLSINRRGYFWLHLSQKPEQDTV